MSKFKVGDKVRILDGSKIENYTGCWNGAMEDHVGEVYTIKHIDTDWTNGRVSYHLNNVLFNWDERSLELVSEKKIVITTDGKNTFATLYDGKKVVSKACASCAPDDKFDFNVGANLAFTRLMGTSPTAASLDWDKFAHGKLAVKVNKKTYDAFMKQCEQRDFICGDLKEKSPWKLFDEMPYLAKAIIEQITGAPGEHIYISVVGRELKWREKRDENLDEYGFI